MFARKSDAKIDAKIDVEADTGRAAFAPPPSAPAYGIEDAIQLMRSLPTEQNMDLVVRVVRVTLGSLDVRFEDIISDATRKQKAIQETISGLHGQVADLEKQLDARRREIAAQEADLKETTAVKERLYLAEKSAGGQRAPTPTPSMPEKLAAGQRAPNATPMPSQGQAAGRANLPRPALRDESGEIPEILSEVDLSDLTVPSRRPSR